MAKCEERLGYRYITRSSWIDGSTARMVSIVTCLCWLMIAAGATASSTHAELTHSTQSNDEAASRVATLTALTVIARHHPDRFPQLLADFAAATAAANANKNGDDGGRVPEWATSEGGEQLDDWPNDAADDFSSAFSSGPAPKRALSVLSRWQPFTSLGNAGRRASRFPHRGRPIGGPRDFISAETRGDFGDRPIGQPMRWGRR